MPPVTQPYPGAAVRPSRPAGLVSGEAVTLDLRPARMASRMLATGLDFLVTYTAALLLLLLLGAVAAGAGIDDALGATLSLLILVGCLIGYGVAMQVLFRGRTLGKMALGLRVVRDDGGPVTFRAALIRELVGFVVEKPGPLLGLPAIVLALAREDGKRVGDLAAGTIVISERVARVGPGLGPAYLPPELAGWASGLDLSRLPDDVALRGREVLGRAATLRPQAREELGALMVAAFAAAVGPPPPGTPGWAYLSAVLAERRRREDIRLARPPGGASAVGTATGPAGTSGAAGPGPGPVTMPGPRRERGTAAYDNDWHPIAAEGGRP